MDGSALSCASSATIVTITSFKTLHRTLHRGTRSHHAAQHLRQQCLKPLAVAPFLLEIFQQLLRPFELEDELCMQIINIGARKLQTCAGVSMTRAASRKSLPGQSRGGGMGCGVVR
jgi:hypothetical protein